MMQKKYILLVLALFIIGEVNATVDWVGNMFPGPGSNNTRVIGDPLTIYVQVYKAGVTEPAGQGAGIICQIYYGEVANFGDPWMNINTINMTYNVDIGNNDEYQGDLTPALGNYEFTCRCSDDGGSSWTWVDTGGAGNGQLSVDAPVPVSLSSFTSKAYNNTISLKWTTESEENNSHFDIERSSDSRHWLAIGTLAGRGTSATQNQYDFLDENPAAGNNYYRLKQVDYDGRFEYSNTVLAKIDYATAVIYPNPVSHELFIPSDITTTGDVVEVYSLQGALMKTFLVTNNDLTTLDCSILPNGIYLLSIRDEYGAVKNSQRFLKD